MLPLSLSSILLSLVFNAAILFSSVLAVPDPLSGSSSVEVRDPSIGYNSDLGKYFVFTTGSKLPVYTSDSLNGPWSKAGYVLPDCTKVKIPGKIPGNCNLWAPSIHFVNGEYALYYSVSSIGYRNSAIGVATSPSMKSGTWTDLGEVMHSREDKDDFNAIDPDLVDDNGLKLSFGSYGAGIFQIDIGPDINKASSSTPGNHLSGGNGRPAEGGITFKPDESPYWFHLFSEGVTPLKGSKSARPSAGKEYKVLVGRAENSTGPFVGKLGHPLTEDRDPATGSLVLGSHDNVYAPGGQSLFKDPVSGRYVMCYHYVPANASLGSPSYLGLNYVDFSSGWPVIVD